MKNPRLLVISGVLQGRVFAIPVNGEFLEVGRDATNHVCIPDPLASSCHFAVRYEPEGTMLSDRKTRNGTLIDHKYHIRKRLDHGDRILCGNTAIIYLEREDPLDVLVNLDEEIQEEAYRQQKAATLRVDYSVRAEAAIYYKDVLNALGNIAESLDTIEKFEAVAPHLLDMTFSVIPARRGAILLNGLRVSPAEPDFTTQFYRERNYSGRQRFFWSSLDKKALDWVYTRRLGYMTNTPASVLCFPLISNGIMRGVLYLDVAEPQCRFEAEHLQIVSLVARNVVSALGANRRFEAVSDRLDLLQEQSSKQQQIIGESPSMQKVRQQMERVARQDVTVLILGETGTGKEAVAYGIHQMSRRNDKPFVAINCGGLREEFLQSDLFGHVKGGYTGAINARRGKLKQADGGTVLLDELGELGGNIQVALLRVLQQRRFCPLGSDDELEVDVRIIAATNVDLDEAVRLGRFRQDLLYRLNICVIELPPLRERREDIPLLADHFVKKYASPGRGVTEIAADTMEILMNYDWPGNIRELENVIQAAIINGDSNTILVTDLSRRLLDDAHPAAAETNIKANARRVAEQAMISDIRKKLAKNNGNKTRTAQELGINRSYLYKALGKGD